MRNYKEIKEIHKKIDNVFQKNITDGLEFSSSHLLFHEQVLDGVEKFVHTFPCIVNHVSRITSSITLNKIVHDLFVKREKLSEEEAKKSARQYAPKNPRLYSYTTCVFPDDKERMIAFPIQRKTNIEDMEYNEFLYGNTYGFVIAHELTHVLCHVLRYHYETEMMDEVESLYLKAVKSGLVLGEYCFRDPEEFLCEMISMFVYKPKRNKIVRECGRILLEKVKKLNKH